MNKFIFFMSISCFLSSYTFAGDNDPTIFYGSAATPDGKHKEFLVEQPKDAPNPLGDPIMGPDRPVEDFGDLDGLRDNQSQLNNQSQSNNGSNENYYNQNSLGNDFENTLLEANDRVYDVQSYPVDDFNVIGNPANPQTIYSPNVNN